MFLVQHAALNAGTVAWSSLELRGTSMLTRSLNIVRRLWRGAVRMSEATAGRRFPAINIFTAALTLLLIAVLPASLIMSWGTQRGLLGYPLSALLIFVWLVFIAVVMSYGREDEAS
jgi:hypothetical protein